MLLIHFTDEYDHIFYFKFGILKIVKTVTVKNSTELFKHICSKYRVSRWYSVK